ncbi:putative sulfate exporter family transporter [Georgenia satyanarayanai]|uniref:YeiH family protein n=1 Tax=Georgenia satyanarayanai TaxID=860221 RepID=UPI00203B95DC|nr:putative sulfate exporter family transporter [Georgenia satyanarayanai]MCM3659741.1 putative sulfate exporter family transporter [Georgenia satyanarayanai]
MARPEKPALSRPTAPASAAADVPASGLVPHDPSGAWHWLGGVALCAAVAALATLAGSWVPLMGGPVLGIVLGIVLGRLLPSTVQALRPGLRFTSKAVLQAAVVLLGAGLSLGQVARTGLDSLPVMVGTLLVALGGTALLGRRLGLGEQTRTLIGVGTGICGASAIATVSAVIGASEVAVSLAVTTIFVFNVLAAVLFPVLGHALGLGQEAFGLWAGTAINDTSSVVAAATVYGAAATSYAVVVKLSRTLMIIPVSVALAVRGHRAERRAADGTGQAAAGVPWRKLVPAFLVLFLVAAALNTAGVVPDAAHDPIKWISVFLTTMAMTAIGLSTPVAALKEAGWRPLALGGILSVAVAASSLGLQALTGAL